MAIKTKVSLPPKIFIIKGMLTLVHPLLTHTTKTKMFCKLCIDSDLREKINWENFVNELSKHEENLLFVLLGFPRWASGWISKYSSLMAFVYIANQMGQPGIKFFVIMLRLWRFSGMIGKLEGYERWKDGRDLFLPRFVLFTAIWASSF